MRLFEYVAGVIGAASTLTLLLAAAIALGNGDGRVWLDFDNVHEHELEVLVLAFGGALQVWLLLRAAWSRTSSTRTRSEASS